MNQRMTDQVALLGAIDADAYTAATYTTGWVAAGEFAQIAGLVAAGDLGASATLDAKLQQATDGSGTGAKDVSGTSITQLTQAGTDSNKQVWINLNPAALDLDNGFGYVRLSMTVGTATSDAAAYLFGYGPRNAPATDQDAATVDEVVSV